MTPNEIQAKIDSIRDRQRPFDSQRTKLLALDANEAASLEIALQLGRVVELLGVIMAAKVAPRQKRTSEQAKEYTFNAHIRP